MNLRELAVHLAELVTKKGRLAELFKEEEDVATKRKEPLPTPGSLTRARALYLLEELFQVIETTLSEGEEIRIVKFGIFRSERVVRSGAFLPGQDKALEPARRTGFFFAPNPYARLRIKEARQNPKNPYLPVLQRDPAAFAKLSGRCPSCNEVLPAKLPLRCVRCGTTPFERKP